MLKEEEKIPFKQIEEKKDIFCKKKINSEQHKTTFSTILKQKLIL